jgi:hypothetical protein
VVFTCPGGSSYVEYDDRRRKLVFTRLTKCSSCSYPPGAVLQRTLKV